MLTHTTSTQTTPESTVSVPNMRDWQQFNDAQRVEEVVELSWWAAVNFHVSELDEWREF